MILCSPSAPPTCFQVARLLLKILTTRLSGGMSKLAAFLALSKPTSLSRTLFDPSTQIPSRYRRVEKLPRPSRAQSSRPFSPHYETYPSAPRLPLSLLPAAPADNCRSCP